MRRMREQSVPGSPSPSYREPGYEAKSTPCLERAPLGPYVTHIRRSIRLNSGMYHLHSTVHVMQGDFFDKLKLVLEGVKFTMCN